MIRACGYDERQMFASLVLLALRSEPLRLNDRSVGRREYAIEIRLEGLGAEPDVERATIAERLVRAPGGFRRTRAVAAAHATGSFLGTGSPIYTMGESDAAAVAPDGLNRNVDASRILLPDLSLPAAPPTPGLRWTSDVFAKVFCRYDGTETLAGRPAHRIAILDVDAPALRGAKGFVLLDAGDALPLQAFVSLESTLNGKPIRATYRLRRANVPGLGWPE